IAFFLTLVKSNQSATAFKRPRMHRIVSSQPAVLGIEGAAAAAATNPATAPLDRALTVASVQPAARGALTAGEQRSLALVNRDVSTMTVSEGVAESSDTTGDVVRDVAAERKVLNQLRKHDMSVSIASSANGALGVLKKMKPTKINPLSYAESRGLYRGE